MLVDAAVLRLVRAVHDEGSISAAARRLGVSQPAASQQLRRAERRLGTALVERVGRGSRLTGPGRVLLRHAVAVEQQLVAAERELRAATGLAAGTVRLVAFPTATARLVPRALARLRDAHPDLHVELAEEEPPTSLAALREGTADVVVLFEYRVEGVDGDEGVAADLAGLHTQALLDDEVRVAVPARDAPGRGRGVRLGSFAAADWVAGCPRCRSHLVDLAAAEGFVPRIRYSTDDHVAVRGLVAEGLGVALLPSLAARGGADDDGVALVPLDPVQRRHVLAATTSDLARVPAVRAVLDALGAAAAEHAAAQDPGRA